MLLFLLLVALPTVLSVLYFGFIATDRYLSEAQLTIRQPSGGTLDPLSGMLLNIAGQSNNNDSYIVQNYIQSRGIVDKLEKRIGMSKFYKTGEADWLSRLPENATREDMFEYFLNHVEASFDQQSGVVDLTVSAFRPEDAKLIADSIVALSDDMVNRVSERARTETVKFSESQARQARSQLERARLRITQFRRRHGELDPVRSAQSIGQIVGSLEGEISSAGAEIASLRSFLDDRSPQVTAMKARIQALKTQLINEKGRLASDSKDETYVKLLDEYERLRLDEQFALTSYTSAEAATTMARTDASRRQLYLIAFVPPSLPDTALEPRRMWLIASTFGLCLLGYGIIMLVTSAVREHANY